MIREGAPEADANRMPYPSFANKTGAWSLEAPGTMPSKNLKLLLRRRRRPRHPRDEVRIPECCQSFKLVLAPDGASLRNLDTPHVSSLQDISENLQQNVNQDIHFLANKNVNRPHMSISVSRCGAV